MFTAPVGTLIYSLRIKYHMYADDTQIYTAIDMSSPNCLSQLTISADAVTGWFIWNNLLLNPNKMEAIITGTHQQVAKFDKAGGVAVSGSIIPFTQKLRILGLTIDGQLSFDDHIIDIVWAYNYHIRALRHICPLINHDTANTVACSIVFLRLDYCNAILYSVSEHNISRLQCVQNSLPRVVCQAPYRPLATHLRHALHWLPVMQCIEYNVASLTFKVRLHHQPTYLSELVVDHVPTRSMRSSDKVLLVMPRTKTVTVSHAFRIAVPKT